MTLTNTVDTDLLAMMESVFASFAPRVGGELSAVEFDPKLWSELTDLGLARLTGGEQAGGSGGSWFDAAGLLGTAAASAVPVPVVEHDLIAGWLLESAGMPIDDGLMTAAFVDSCGTARAVPWARSADRLVLVKPVSTSSWAVCSVAASTIRIDNGRNLAGEHRDTVHVDLDAQQWVTVSGGVGNEMVLRGALARSLQICGALEKILELCITHAITRTQFGRPLSKFQAVQHMVADIASETALARMAADAAVAKVVRSEWGDDGVLFAIAVAKSCAGHAVSSIVRQAHQIHGAIGTTNEHQLHRYTKSVLSWRSEYGSVRSWDNILTEAAIASASGNLWSLIVDGGHVTYDLTSVM